MSYHAPGAVIAWLDASRLPANFFPQVGVGNPVSYDDFTGAPYYASYKTLPWIETPGFQLGDRFNSQRWYAIYQDGAIEYVFFDTTGTAWGDGVPPSFSSGSFGDDTSYPNPAYKGAAASATDLVQRFNSNVASWPRDPFDGYPVPGRLAGPPYGPWDARHYNFPHGGPFLDTLVTQILPAAFMVVATAFVTAGAGAGAAAADTAEAAPAAVDLTAVTPPVPIDVPPPIEVPPIDIAPPPIDIAPPPPIDVPQLPEVITPTEPLELPKIPETIPESGWPEIHIPSELKSALTTLAQKFISRSAPAPRPAAGPHQVDHVALNAPGAQTPVQPMLAGSGLELGIAVMGLLLFTRQKRKPRA